MMFQMTEDLIIGESTVLNENMDQIEDNSDDDELLALRTQALQSIRPKSDILIGKIEYDKTKPDDRNKSLEFDHCKVYEGQVKAKPGPDEEVEVIDFGVMDGRERRGQFRSKIRSYKKSPKLHSFGKLPRASRSRMLAGRVGRSGLTPLDG